MRRSLITLSILVWAGIVLAEQAGRPTSPSKAFSVVEASIPEMQAALQQGRVTSRELVLQYLVRIATYEDSLNAVITLNPKALEEADARDRERAQGRSAARCTAFPSRSRTTSTRPTCRRREARWPSRASFRPTRRRSRRTSARPAPSSSRRPGMTELAN